MACAPSEDSDQPVHLPSPIEPSLSAWRKFGSLATHWSHSEDWSDGADLGWSESSLGAQAFCWFCHEAAQLFHCSVKGLLKANEFWKDADIKIEKNTVEKFSLSLLICSSTNMLMNEPCWEKPVFAICRQQRHRSACTSTQSDQCLCSRYKYSIIPNLSKSKISRL